MAKLGVIIWELAAATAGALILIIVALYVVFCICRRKKHQDDKVTSKETPPVTSSESRNQRFTYAQVRRITNDFKTIIGRGGLSGTVYHGHLDGIQVAVKMLSTFSSKGYKEFTDDAQFLLRVHHRNLISLVGYCDEGDKMGLIYEFMSQGDLYINIFDKNRQHLTWEERLHISLDAARGLERLHNGSTPPLLHGDIKSASILLSDNFVAKLAGFGLSRACLPDGQEDFVPVLNGGPSGYLDPEYYQTIQLNAKSDVYSFGVVLLEVMTSKPAMVRTADDKIHISKWVGQMLSKNEDVEGIIDSRLRGEFDKNSACKFIEVAMACVSLPSDQRPIISQVVNELSHCLSMEIARKSEGFNTDTMDSVEIVCE